jgi:hypothetical protein
MRHGGERRKRQIQGGDREHGERQNYLSWMFPLTRLTKPSTAPPGASMLIVPFGLVVSEPTPAPVESVTEKATGLPPPPEAGARTIEVAEAAGSEPSAFIASEPTTAPAAFTTGIEAMEHSEFKREPEPTPS